MGKLERAGMVTNRSYTRDVLGKMSVKLHEAKNQLRRDPPKQCYYIRETLAATTLEVRVKVTASIFHNHFYD